MKIKDQEVSLELAREMKELGVKQDSLWFWTWVEWNEEVEWVLIQQDKIPRLKKECFSAYTVAELGEMLPSGFYTYYDQYDGWTCSSSWGFYTEETEEEEIIVQTVWGALKRPKKDRLWEEAQTEADARAKLLIYLIKEGIIKVEDIK